MRALFMTALVLFALTAGAMAYFASVQTHLSGEPHAILKLAPPPADFDAKVKEAVLALYPPPKPVAPPPAPVEAVPPQDVALPSSGSGSGDPAPMLPGLSVEGFNEPLDTVPDAENPAKAKKAAVPEVAPEVPKKVEAPKPKADASKPTADEPKIENAAVEQPVEKAAKVEPVAKPEKAAKLEPVAKPEKATAVKPAAKPEKVAKAKAKKVIVDAAAEEANAALVLVPPDPAGASNDASEP